MQARLLASLCCALFLGAGKGAASAESSGKVVIGGAAYTAAEVKGSEESRERLLKSISEVEGKLFMHYCQSEHVSSGLLADIFDMATGEVLENLKRSEEKECFFLSNLKMLFEKFEKRKPGFYSDYKRVFEAEEKICSLVEKIRGALSKENAGSVTEEKIARLLKSFEAEDAALGTKEDREDRWRPFENFLFELFSRMKSAVRKTLEEGKNLQFYMKIRRNEVCELQEKQKYLKEMAELAGNASDTSVARGITDLGEHIRSLDEILKAFFSSIGKSGEEDVKSEIGKFRTRHQLGEVKDEDEDRDLPVFYARFKSRGEFLRLVDDIVRMSAYVAQFMNADSKYSAKLKNAESLESKVSHELKDFLEKNKATDPHISKLEGYLIELRSTKWWIKTSCNKITMLLVLNHEKISAAERQKLQRQIEESGHAKCKEVEERHQDMHSFFSTIEQYNIGPLSDNSVLESYKKMRDCMSDEHFDAKANAFIQDYKQIKQELSELQTSVEKKMASSNQTSLPSTFVKSQAQSLLISFLVVFVVLVILGALRQKHARTSTGTEQT